MQEVSIQFWNDFAFVHAKQVDTVNVLGSLKHTKTFLGVFQRKYLLPSKWKQKYMVVMNH